MKKTLVVIAVMTMTASSGYCKPGGWLWDILDRSTINVQTGYGYNQPVYYRPAPVYYQPAPVYYQPAPVYYQPAPVYYQQPCGTSYNYQGQRYNHGHRH